MRIGILGAGSIGATLTRRLSEAGHEVKVANSRGPATIDSSLLVTGATAVDARDVASEVEVVISSVPFNATPTVASLLAHVSSDVVFIDTSNYYPSRDGRVAGIDKGQVESDWVVQTLGRPVAKAWNAITSGSLADKATAPGTPGRIAIPVAADREADRAVALQLVDDTGFDAFDAGPLEASWRQQPGAPAYCTDLTSGEMPSALAAAEKDMVPQIRDLIMSIVAVRTKRYTMMDDSFAEWLVRLNRAAAM